MTSWIDDVRKNDTYGQDKRVADALWRLSRSAFRSRFNISQKDRDYALSRGRETILSHVRDFVEKRLAPAEPKNDGKQTPMRGHPAFTAQHATATCCRSCLEKWHGVEKGREMTKEEIDFACALIAKWLDLHMVTWK